MTPEEKAKELVDKYKGVAKYGQRQWGQTSYAKQAALIAVDEILNMMTLHDGELKKVYWTNFWQQTKDAIQSL